MRRSSWPNHRSDTTWLNAASSSHATYSHVRSFPVCDSNTDRSYERPASLAATVKILSNLAGPRLPRVFGPFDDFSRFQRHRARLGLRLTSHSHQLTFLASLRPRGFAPPRRLLPKSTFRPCFMPVPSMGFHAFEGFSPSVAPMTSRPPVSSLPLPLVRARALALRLEPSQPPPAQLRGCQQRTDALSSPRVFSAPRDSLLPWSLSPPRYFLLELALRFRTAPLLGFSVFVVRTSHPRNPVVAHVLHVRNARPSSSSCSSECHRSEKAARL